MATSTEDTGPPEDATAASRASPTRAPVRTGLLLAAVLVLGLLLGALTASLLGDDPVVVEVATTPEDQAGTGPSVGAEDASARFVVTGACLGAVNAAQDTLLLLDDLGEAAAQLDAARLDEIVRRLMPLETRLQTGLEACRVSTEVDAPGEEPGGSTTPAPTTPGSPASPTDAGD